MGKKLTLAATEQYEVPTPSAVNNVHVYLAGIMGLAAALDYGYDLGFIGTAKALGSYERYFGTIDNESYKESFDSNVVSFFQIGAIIGSVAAAPATIFTGRKPANIGAAFLFILGSLLQSVAGLGGSNGAAMMLAGRLINGISVGASNTIAPMIVAELSPPRIRGRMVGLYEVGVQTGTMLGFWVNYGLVRHHPSNDLQWRTSFILQFLFGSLYMLLSLFVPESPRYYAKLGRDKVTETLGRIRNLPTDHEYLAVEVDDIMKQYEREQELPGWKGVFRELKTPSIRRRFILIGILFIFFQFSGTNSVNYYSPTIFRRLGVVGQETAFLATGIYGLVRFAAVLVAMLWAVDRFGRRPLLIIFGGIMAVCMWIIGALVKEDVRTKGTLALIYIYAAAFCFSYAGLPYIINTEVWPTRIRPYGVSYGVAMHWIFNLIIGKSTPYLIKSLDYGFFWFYAGFLSCGSVFVFFFIPETKDVPLERMEALFGGTNPANFANTDTDATNSLEAKPTTQHIA